MRAPFVLLFCALAAPLSAGQLVWSPGEPALTLSLGDGAVRKVLDLPAGASTLTLTLKAYLLDDVRLRLTWKDGESLWLRQSKKIPGDETTMTMALPPGENITLEIATEGGSSVAMIRLRRK